MVLYHLKEKYMESPYPTLLDFFQTDFGSISVQLPSGGDSSDYEGST